jgi:hypothetical protein
MKSFTVLGLFSVAAFALATAACGDEPGSSSSDNNNGGSANSGGGSAGSGAGAGMNGGAGPTCEAPAPPHAAQQFTVDSAAATIMGTDGTPAAGITFKVCGTDICSDIVNTDAQGDASVSPQIPFIDPRVVYGSGKTHAEFAVFLENTDVVLNYPLIHAITLPTYAQGAAMAPGMDVSNNGVTLSIPADAVIDHDNLLYSEESQRVFRTNTLETGLFNFPAIDASGLNIEVVVALAPNNTVICPKATLTVPNAGSWNPGDGVDFYVHGHLTFKHYAPYGEWTKVAEGTVSADGQTIRTNDGEGIELLSTYGLVRQ